MSVFFDKMRSRRSVLKRTTKRPDLPKALLYLEWLPGDLSRKVLDVDGKERVFADTLLESHYKVAGGAEAKKLVAAHWQKEAAAPGEPVRNPESK